MTILEKDTLLLYLKGKLDLSFDAVKSLYIAVIILYPVMAFVYPILLPGTYDPVFLRMIIGLAIAVVYILALKYKKIRDNMIYSTVFFYYVLSGHTLYLIYANDMAVEYVVGLVIIVGVGHAIFSNFKQVVLFLIFLTLGCSLVVYHVDTPTTNAGTFLISVLLIGFFAFISLVLRFNLSRKLIVSSFIIDNVSEGIMGVSMDDTITYANDNIHKIIGYTKKELIGKDVKQFLASREDKAIVEGKTDVRKLGVAEKYELNFLHKNGHVVNTEISATPTYNNSGRADGSVALITNITSRKKVEEELKKQSLIASKTDSYVILTNKEDEIEYVNKSFEKYTGYTLEEVKGKRPEDFLHGSETNRNTIKVIRSKRREQSGFSEEIKNYTKDGRGIWLSLHVTPLKNENDEVNGFITIGNDITARKLAEEKLKLDSFRLGIIREIDRAIIASQTVSELAYSTVKYLKKLLPQNADINISIANPNKESYATIDAKGTISRPCTEIPSQIIKRLMGGKPRVVTELKAAQHLMEQEKELITKGIQAYVLIPLLYNNELMGTLNVFWEEKNDDMPEHIELIEGAARDLAISIKQLALQKTISQKNVELENQLSELEATHEELRSFSYIVSHDLKAPLRAISSLAQWLENDYKDRLDGEGQEYLGMLMNRTNRLHHLIEGILAYSRIGRKDLEKEVVNTQQVVKSTIELLHASETACVEIQKDLPEVYYNAVQLQQIFQNLIGNAIKFMDKTDSEITVGCEDAGNHYEFYVQDNGPGIKPEHFDRVFKIFQTLQARDDIESTGIGLTIVKKIIEINSGQVWLDKNVKIGTCIRFTILKLERNN